MITMSTPDAALLVRAAEVRCVEHDLARSAELVDPVDHELSGGARGQGHVDQGRSEHRSPVRADAERRPAGSPGRDQLAGLDVEPVRGGLHVVREAGPDVAVDRGDHPMRLAVDRLTAWLLVRSSPVTRPFDSDDSKTIDGLDRSTSTMWTVWLPADVAIWPQSWLTPGVSGSRPTEAYGATYGRGHGGDRHQRQGPDRYQQRQGEGRGGEGPRRLRHG